MASCKESRTHGYPHTHVDQLTPRARSSSCHHGFCPSSPRKLTRRLLPLNAAKTRWRLSAPSSGFGPGPKARDGQGRSPDSRLLPSSLLPLGFPWWQWTGRIPGRRVEQRMVGGKTDWRWGWRERWELKEDEAKERGDGGINQGSTSLGSQKSPRKEGAWLRWRQLLGKGWEVGEGDEWVAFLLVVSGWDRPGAGGGGGGRRSGLRRGRSRGREKRQDICLDPGAEVGVGGKEAGPEGGEVSNNWTEGVQPQRPELWALAVLHSLTWHNLVTVSLRVYARTESEEGKGSAKCTIIIYSNSRAESRGRASTASRPTAKGRKRTKKAEKQLLAKAT